MDLTNERKLIPFCPVPIQTWPALSSIKSVILLSAIDFSSIGSCSKWFAGGGLFDSESNSTDKQLIPGSVSVVYHSLPDLVATSNSEISFTTMLSAYGVV